MQVALGCGAGAGCGASIESYQVGPWVLELLQVGQGFWAATSWAEVYRLGFKHWLLQAEMMGLRCRVNGPRWRFIELGC